MTNPRGIAAMDQIEALLRASQLPVSTIEIACQMPPISQVVPCPGGDHGEGPYYTAVHLAGECHGDHHHIVRRPTNQEAYRLLRHMERQGLVARAKFDTSRQVFWSWTGPAAVSVEQLNEMWEVER